MNRERRKPSARRVGNDRVAKPQPNPKRNVPSSTRRTGNSQPPVPQLPATLPPTLMDQALKKPEFAAKISVMYSFGKAIVKKGIVGCQNEFKRLRMTHIEATHTAFDQNLKKCRYKDVFCTDKTRVVLKNQSPDFIHANYVKDEVLLNTFICCQGPLLHTCRDFWSMVWQERALHIMMLCKVEENNKVKCARYYPSTLHETMQFGSYQVKNAGMVTEGNLLFTRLILQRGREARGIEHRQWVTWPDKFIPQHVEPAFQLLDVARSSPTHPTVVHCSAGIGRTGTLVILEYLLRSLEQGIEPNVPAVLLNIRQQRAQAVQTEDQYIYVHYAILQKILNHGIITQNEAKPFCSEYEKYLKAMGAPIPIPLPRYAEPQAPAPRVRKTVRTVPPRRKSSDEEEKKDDKRGRASVKALPPREVVPDFQEVTATPENYSPPSTITCVDQPDPEESRHKPDIYFKSKPIIERETEQKRKVVIKPEPTVSKEITSSEEAKKSPSSEYIYPHPFKGSSGRVDKGRDGITDRNHSPINKSSKSTKSSDSSEEVGSVYYYTGMGRSPFIKSKSERRRRSRGAKGGRPKEQGSSKEPSLKDKHK